MNKGLRFMV